MKKRILITFSGGETSGYMLWWMLNAWEDRSNNKIVVIFANTGEETNETLDFVERCSKEFNVKIVWVEAVPRFKVNGVIANVMDFLDKILDTNWVGGKVGTKHKIVSYKTATRNQDWKTKGTPFEAVIAKFGMPNINTSHCTRELKERPITSYLRSIGWKAGTYLTAIGIRNDEFDRVNSKHKELNLIYPLVSLRPMNKPKINFWWEQQAFRLPIKGYQGNCRWCYKKYIKKHYKQAKEDKSIYDFPIAMEKKYGNYIPETKKSSKVKLPITFFREYRSGKDIIRESKSFNEDIIDDSRVYSYQSDIFEEGSESCEVFTECGD